uniref:Uncharacterized protein n=1 Tax=Anopheles melas TaxID=34690 RepID=A0A182TF25_9DIPT
MPVSRVPWLASTPFVFWPDEYELFALFMLFGTLIMALALNTPIVPVVPPLSLTTTQEGLVDTKHSLVSYSGQAVCAVRHDHSLLLTLATVPTALLCFVEVF